ncbi:MAG: hypothetical protein LBM74_09835, partial [Oscillospiraceae bacterium]|nr:hypothetical protein [Oscillospiraceae bacterium]
MKSTRKFLSILLTVLMFVQYIPATVLAEEEGTPAPISVSLIVEDDTLEYNGASQKSTKTVAESILQSGHYWFYEFYAAERTDLGTSSGSLVSVDILDSASGTSVANQYSITTVPGNLTIIESDDLTASVSGYNAPYDGQPHGITITPNLEGALVEYSTNGSGFDTTYPTITHVSESPKVVDYRVSKDGYATVTGSETITIGKRPVTITVPNAEKEFDTADPAFLPAQIAIDADSAIAEALLSELSEISLVVTRSGWGGEAVRKHENELIISKSQYELNEQYRNFDFTVVNGNFTIKENTSMVLDDPNITVTYDGEYHGAVITSNLPDTKIGYALTNSYVNMLPKSPEFKDRTVEAIFYLGTKEGYDSKGGVMVLTIEPRPVTLTIPSMEKIYGEEITDYGMATLSEYIGDDLDGIDLTVERDPEDNTETVGNHPGVLSIVGYPGDYVNVLNAIYHNYEFNITRGDLLIKENPGIVITAQNYEEYFDNQSHGITATANIDGVEIKYSADGGETYTLNQSPKISSVKDSPLTVYYRATKEGYTTREGTATVTIKKKPVTVTIQDNSKKYMQVEPYFQAFVKVVNPIGTEMQFLANTVIRSDAGTPEGQLLGLHEGVLTLSETDEQLKEHYPDYDITVIPGNFTINKSNDLGITTMMTSRVYSGQPQGIYIVQATHSGDATITYRDEDGNYTLDTCPT